MAAAWVRRLGGVALQLRTHVAAAPTMFPRMPCRSMCAQASSIPDMPDRPEAGNTRSNMSEVLRRMVTMENACQMEKNRLNVWEAMKKHRRHETDTGSPEAQVAVFTERINYLQAHVKSHHKDHAVKRGLTQLVDDRKKMLKYLKRKSLERYNTLIASLGIRDVISLVPARAFLPAKAAIAADLKIKKKAQLKANALSQAKAASALSAARKQNKLDAAVKRKESEAIAREKRAKKDEGADA